MARTSCSRRLMEPGLERTVVRARSKRPLLYGLMALFSELHEWANGLPLPKSVLMLSAHWEARPLTIGATRTVPLIYDFYGFPEPFYRVEYAAPGAPELAQRVKELIGKSQPLAEDPDRGLVPVPCVCDKYKK